METQVQGQVRIEDLTKTYRTRQRRGLFRSDEKLVEALRGVSLEIHPGELFGLLGPNGAGKTTLIKCLTTLLLPSSGAAWLNGFRLTEQDNQIRATVGCMLMGERGLYWKLTGRENLEFFGALYHLSPAARRRRAGEVIERLKLGDIADRAVETYSSGQKMKLAFSALLGRLPAANLPLGVLILALALCGTFGTGFAFAALTLRVREAGQTLANLFQFVFMVICAPFFPFSALPQWMQLISRAIPLSYGVDAFRSTLMGYPPGFPELAPLPVELVIVAAFGLLMPVLGYWLFRREEDHARRQGSLSEY